MNADFIKYIHGFLADGATADDEWFHVAAIKTAHPVRGVLIEATIAVNQRVVQVILFTAHGVNL